MANVFSNFLKGFLIALGLQIGISLYV